MRAIRLEGGRREGRAMRNYFLQLAASASQHREALGRLLVEGWTVIEHTEADATAFKAAEPQE